MAPYLHVASAVIVLLIGWCYSKRPRSQLPLPPGPKKIPFLGNLLDMPSTFEWETYMEWSKKYNSDVLHLNVAGKSLLILSSMQAAEDLLVKRGGTFSDRPRLPMVNELMSWEAALSTWRRRRLHRRLLHDTLNGVAVQKFRRPIRDSARWLLQRLAQDPDPLLSHLRHMAGKIIISVAYGIQVTDHDDPYVALAEEAVEGLTTALVPGRFLVDALPILKYVPAWFPGAGFKRKAALWGKLATRMMEEPYAEVKHQMACFLFAIGTAPHSFTREALYGVEQSENKDSMEHAIRSAARSLYTAGTGTTVSVIGTFVIAMLSNPEAQRKAQMEIDAVVGKSRLPDFDDEESLPYVSAVVKEVLRWINPTPIAIPHFLASEDEYRGYRLPAGSIVMPNVHAILHDEAVYPDPYAFNPERYLLNGKLNPEMPSPEIVFGFGRRICPGRHMASLSVWISVASILATFDITKAVGEDGEIIEPIFEYFPALVVQPRPFKCRIKPRSGEALQLIQATSDDDE
ncbi:cytochrome P450 [Mycena vulgaris]|nr:cytochrome P450 [Mycena vulgaris]